MNAEKSITDENEITFLLEEWQRKQRQNQAICETMEKCFIYSWLVGTAIGLLGLLGYMMNWWNKSANASLWAMFWFFAPVFVSIICTKQVERRCRRMHHPILKINDVRAVAPLLTAVESCDVDERIHFAEALTHLLPQVVPSDNFILDAAQKSVLYSSAFRQSAYHAGTEIEKKAYRLAAIKLIEKIGDGDAVWYLPSIVRDEEENAEIKHAAEIALEAVKQRAEQTKESTTLLRASEDTAADATLLKPAMPQDAEQDNLLRPVV